jgi:hypothetical protein
LFTARYALSPYTKQTILAVKSLNLIFMSHAMYIRLNFDTKTVTVYMMVCIYGLKAILLQAWTGPEGPRRLRLPDFKSVVT